MTENPNGAGTNEFLSKKAQTAWTRAEKIAGQAFIDQLKSPNANPFYEYQCFCRQRSALTISSGVTNRADLGAIKMRTLTDVTTTAFFQNSLNDATKSEGRKLIEVEAQRITELLKPKKHTAEITALN